MSQCSTPAASRPASVLFDPQGVRWVPCPVGMDGPALAVWRAVYQLHRGGIVTAPDRVIAGMIGKSPRHVQEGLRLLEESGWITRGRRHGGRVITIVGRLAGGNTHSQAKAAPSRKPRPSPLNGGINREETHAVPPARPTGVPAKEPESWVPSAKERRRLDRWPAFAAAMPPAP